MEVSSDETDSADTDQNSDYIRDTQSEVDLEETARSVVDTEETGSLGGDKPVRKSARVLKPKEYPDYVTYFVIFPVWEKIL